MWLRKLLPPMLLVILSCGHLSALAEISAASVDKLVKESGVLAASDEFKVGISGTEIGVNTYISSQTKDVSTDAKINAVLLAKKIMDGEPSVTRVTTRFYDPKTAGYYQVAVTLGDIKAFASGAVSKDKLLQSLRLDSVRGTKEDVSKASEHFQEHMRMFMAMATTGPHGGTAGGTADSSDKAGGKSSEPKRPVSESAMAEYHESGLNFSCPSVFRQQQSWMPEMYKVAEFVNDSPTLSHPKIKIYVLTDGRDVNAWLKVALKYHGKAIGYQRYQAPPVVICGPQKISALNIFYSKDSRYSEWGIASDDEIKKGAKPVRYEREVFFGWPGCVYAVKMSCQYEDYHKTLAAFETMLRTMKLERRPS